MVEEDLYYDYDEELSSDFYPEDDDEFLEMISIRLHRQGDYCLGKCIYSKMDNIFLLDFAVRLEWMYENNVEVIEEYLQEFSVSEFYPNLHILQIFKQKCPYTNYLMTTVVIKTFWIRIVQRTWKRVCKEWKQKTISLENILSRQRTGKNIAGFGPSLRGIISR